MYQFNDIYQATKTELPKSRWHHSLRVMETALKLGKKYDLNPKDIRVAAILHDYCKFWPKEQLDLWIQKYNLPPEFLKQGPEISHGPIAAKVAEIKFKITDLDIINSIAYHTSGRPKMSLLEKIIFIADCTEPARIYDGVDKVRELAKYSIDEAVLLSLEQIITKLKTNNKIIFPLTLLARDYYYELINQEESN